jgi:glycosyltransferase involved in cell wall biosynthesis
VRERACNTDEGTMRDKNDITIVTFAGCDWWYHNRGLFCPQTMIRLGRHHKLLFINSLATRFPSLRSDRHALFKILRKLRSLVRFLRKSDNGMYVLTPFSLPFFDRPVIGSLIALLTRLQIRMVMSLLSISKPVIFVACPPAWKVVRKIPHSYLVYQRTDFYEEMPNANKAFLQQCDHELMISADLVIYVNSELYQEGLKKNQNSLLVGHGVDYALFADACDSDVIPEDIAVVPKPRIGFYGDITEDVCDFDLLEFAAHSLPDISFVFIGPISADIKRLQNYPNIFFLGPKPYEEIPSYGSAFDVAIMPWKSNRWIQFCNPVKTKEYLALGRPIVSIDYPALEPYRDVVYVCHNYDQFVKAIREALNDTSKERQLQRQEKVKYETWEYKAELILKAIYKGLGHHREI